MGELTENTVRHIVREEIAASADITALKTDVSRLGVMFEHFDHKMDTVAELVTMTVATRNDTIDLKERVNHLESDVAVLKLAIRP